MMVGSAVIGTTSAVPGVLFGSDSAIAPLTVSDPALAVMPPPVEPLVVGLTLGLFVGVCLGGLTRRCSLTRSIAACGSARRVELRKTRRSSSSAWQQTFVARGSAVAPAARERRLVRRFWIVFVLRTLILRETSPRARASCCPLFP